MLVSYDCIFVLFRCERLDGGMCNEMDSDFRPIETGHYDYR